MRFYLLGAEGEKNTPALTAELRTAKQWGKLFLGEKHLFFRAGWFKVCTIPYSVIRRCFRRVQLIPIKLRGDQKEIRAESLVVCGDGGELAQIPLPGEDAAKKVMAALEKKLPNAQFGKPTDD